MFGNPPTVSQQASACIGWEGMFSQPWTLEFIFSVVSKGSISNMTIFPIKSSRNSVPPTKLQHQIDCQFFFNLEFAGSIAIYQLFPSKAQTMKVRGTSSPSWVLAITSWQPPKTLSPHWSCCHNSDKCPLPSSLASPKLTPDCNSWQVSGYSSAGFQQRWGCNVWEEALSTTSTTSKHLCSCSNPITFGPNSTASEPQCLIDFMTRECQW